MPISPVESPPVNDGVGKNPIPPLPRKTFAQTCEAIDNRLKANDKALEELWEDLSQLRENFLSAPEAGDMQALGAVRHIDEAISNRLKRLNNQQKVNKQFEKLNNRLIADNKSIKEPDKTRQQFKEGLRAHKASTPANNNRLWNLAGTGLRGIGSIFSRGFSSLENLVLWFLGFFR